MDDYPEHLAPLNADSWNPESFRSWWARVEEHLPDVPRNVAKQWIHRHWGQSPYRHVPSNTVTFSLQGMTAKEILEIVPVGKDDYAEWGDYLISLYTRGEYKRPATGVILRRRVWPAPPIILDNRSPPQYGWAAELPSALLIIEGNRRLAIAKAMIRTNTFVPSAPVWMMHHKGNAR